ncbi:MAG TPA: hypothetical protein VMD08_09940 [Candidatus Baltobacteraceae bacterium]|nr:hypothetical protein [Candidatus Baltobacteraceae bacterium]
MAKAFRESLRRKCALQRLDSKAERRFDRVGPQQKDLAELPDVTVRKNAISGELDPRMRVGIGNKGRSCPPAQLACHTEMDDECQLAEFEQKELASPPELLNVSPNHTFRDLLRLPLPTVQARRTECDTRDVLPHNMRLERAANNFNFR